MEFSPEVRASLEAAIRGIMQETCPRQDEAHHVIDTPKRFVKGIAELMSGAGQDPASVLKTGFAESQYDQMIIVEQIDFVSLCMHHLLPFHGFVHFAYLPNKHVVGLSKIPRMIEILSRRPQIQERLTQEIVSTFQKNVEPLGCAAMVEAWHACVGIRGVRKPGSRMRTIALAGVFKDQAATREEFMMSVMKNSK